MQMMTEYGKSPQDAGAVTGTIYLGLDDAGVVDAHYARAKEAGAQITREITDTDYDSHEFGLRDPEGQTWSFGKYRPQAQ